MRKQHDEKGDQMIDIYTDGGCWPNDGTGNGGYAAIVIDAPGQWRRISGARAGTTNNRMELMGVIHGLLVTPHGAEVTVYADSQYVIHGITRWCKRWLVNGWNRKKNGRKPVKNADLWQQLHAVTIARNVTFQWVRGHSGNEWNEMADREASAAVARGNLIPDVRG